ncbi:hypothetical protein [Streptomyces sp. GZWMJZ-114]|uniref:AAA family ATPase n=1 Tax=Streptomyces sp. GZWMJZ-114 TaxID=2494734 RepID=UPI001F507B0D|nr:hypothetical protein [Streptomyces sp. GZWMJZ-114]
MPDHHAPRFEALEGLRGTGKSTLAPLLAADRRAVLVPTVPPLIQPLRSAMDRQTNVEARMCFYLAGLFAASERVRAHLDSGVPVVVESWFARCLATHRALGARLGVTLPDSLPRPVTYYLHCEEAERLRRLTARDKPVSRWDTLAETVTAEARRVYATFPMRRVDTTGRTPGEVLRMITADMRGEPSPADP